MVQSRVEDLSPVVKKVSVELAEDRVKEALDEAYGGLSRTVKLKGYRAGHVPRRLVERYFSEDVKKDVAQKLVSSSMQEVLQEHKLEPVAPPRIESNDVKPGEPFKYVATVEVRPHVAAISCIQWSALRWVRPRARKNIFSLLHSKTRRRDRDVPPACAPRPHARAPRSPAWR